jgi:hypothetical protein
MGQPPTSDIGALRHSTHTGRPLGSRDFVAALEQQMQPNLVPASGGFSPPVEADVPATAGTSAVIDDPLLIFPPARVGMAVMG